MGALAAVFEFLVSLFPSASPPAFLTTDLPGFVTTVSGWFSGFGAWLPVAEVGVATAFVATAIGVAFVIRLVRIVASFLTAGGGTGT